MEMHKPALRGRLGSGVVLFSIAAATLFISVSAVAQGTISGSVSDQSTWDNATIANPPGDGSGNGTLYVGAWNAAGTVQGVPAANSGALASGGMPIGGSGYGYSLGPVPAGDYTMVPWVDADGDGGYDIGEPRGVGVAVTVATNNVVGVNDAVIDDADDDDMADWWEVHFFNNLDQAGADDYDQDGLSNLQEYEIFGATGLVLDPADWDTDGDSMDDGWEYAHYANGFGTIPDVADWNQDRDGDGLLNGQEYRGIDGQPVRQQDPSKAGGIGRINPRDSGDALNPIDLDTDSDCLIDSFEAAWYDPANGINPAVAGSPGADQDADGMTAFREQCLMIPLGEGFGEDLWSWGIGGFPVADGNGVRAFTVLPLQPFFGTSQQTIGADLAALRSSEWTDPTHGSSWSIDLPLSENDGWDTDADQLPDGWEVEFNLDPRSSSGVNGTLGDPDGDTLVNIEEYEGQDGNRSATLPYVNGTGDETNPNEHNWRPDSTHAVDGLGRNGTIGSSLPTISLGTDHGNDSDDDGIPDNTEIQQEYEDRGAGTSPVHSTDPFIRRSAIVTNSAGISMRDPEGSPGSYLPAIHTRDWTIECCFKPTTDACSGWLINMPAGSAPSLPFACRLGLSNNIPYASFYTLGSYQYTVKGLAAPSNRWTHVAGVWNHASNSLALYVDGIFVQEERVFQESVTKSAYYLTNLPTIAQSPDGSFVNRLYVDEVRIWGHARTENEIEQYRTRIVPQNSSGLLAYYRFDDGGATAEDFARKAKNGLIGALSEDYFFGDHGYALRTNSFAFATNEYADVLGVDTRGSDDTDGDGMPDGWEMVNHLNLLSAAGNDGPAGDPDGDKLYNIYEYWSDTNPNRLDTDQDGIFDRNEDYDGDGVVNKTEQDLGSRPDMVDTDDDGVTDNQEQSTHSNPAFPTDPAINRAMWFGGNSNDYVLIPNAMSQRLTDWTIEAWVNPTNTNGGIIIRRVVETPAAGSPAVNFVLGLEPNAGGVRPYAGYSFTNGQSYVARGENIPLDTWTHIAGSYDSLIATLTVYTNGAESGTPVNNAYRAPRPNGKGGETRVCIGGSFEGLVDNVRIWNDVRTPTELSLWYARTVTASAQGLIHDFRFDDGQAVTSVEFPVFGPFFQPHGAQDFAVERDWNNQWRRSAMLHGAAEFRVGGAIEVPPAITVILQPQEAREAGAMWSFDGGAWRVSGDIVADLDPNPSNAQHSVLYRNISGWTEPGSEVVYVTNGMMTRVMRTYQKNGSLTVNLEPADARIAGAAWFVDGGATMSGGETVFDLAPGTHYVSYLSLSGWRDPANEDVVINEDANTIITRTYTRIKGSLRVYIEPLEARTNGAAWRIDTQPWMSHDQVASNLILGTHVVTFSNIAGWVTPATREVSISSDTEQELTATYTKNGFIIINIEPAGARSNGAAWRVDNYSWLDSGQTQVVNRGAHRIYFKDISNWDPPTWYYYSYLYDDYWGWHYYMWVDYGETKIETAYYTYIDDWDNDGLDDTWELSVFGNLLQTALGDYDEDGLQNVEEYRIWTNIPALVGISATNWDSDADGMDDEWEFVRYCNGTGLNPCTNDAAGDADGDGLPNLCEYRGIDGQGPKKQDPIAVPGIACLNTDDTGDASDAVDFDTDGDGLLDSFETAWYDPAHGISPNSSGDPGADSDADGLSNYREQCLLATLGEGGANDIWSEGTNALPMVDAFGLRAMASPLVLTSSVVSSCAQAVPQLRAHEWTDPSHGSGWAGDIPVTGNDGWDSDGDLLPDGWEVEFNLDPRDGGVLSPNGYFGDPDGDWLLNFQEYNGQDGKRAGTNEYVVGTGDETNPNEHNWRPDSTAAGPGIARPTLDAGWWFNHPDPPANGTLGSARPTLSLGTDAGLDTDDDSDGPDYTNRADRFEIQQEFGGGNIGSSPVHSTDPFIKRCASVTNAAGIELPDPEGNPADGYSPMLHSRNWTIECHVKLATTNMSGDLLVCYGPYGAGDIVWRLSLSNNIPQIAFDTLALQRYYVGGMAIPTNRWTHLAGAWNGDANNLALYVDGVFVQEQRIYEESLGGYLYPSVAPARIGVSPDGSFVGNLLIDEVRVWRTARSHSLVEQYRTRLAPQDADGLVAYYRFDDGGRKAEDFARKAKSGLLGTQSENYFFGDFGYALSNNFAFVTNDHAEVRGVDRRGSDDTDGDGMPDGWEMVNHLDPLSSENGYGYDDDYDGDGLFNRYEFWAETNPDAWDTDQDGILDLNEDFDGDYVANQTEQLLGCRPDMIDTDDDGSPDNEEQANGTSPVNATDPAIPRSVRLGGTTNDYLTVRNAIGQRLTDWTIEAWVNPSNPNGGIVVRRVVETPASGDTAVNFVLGLEPNAGGVRPYAGYSFTSGVSYMVHGDNIPGGEWTHLAATYNGLQAKLTMYTNSGVSGTPLLNAYLAPPMNGKGGETFLRIGEGFAGMIDDLRIWDMVRTQTEIMDHYEEAIDGETVNLLHYFRFDDGQARTNATFPVFTDYFQPHGAQDYTVSQDWNEEWWHAAILHGDVEFVDEGAIGVPPSLCVMLDPSRAVDAGAKWSFDSGNWLESGEVIIAEEGSHLIGYKSVYGWTAPANEAILLANNMATNLTRTYLENGGLLVNIEPGGAVAQGAKWAVDGGLSMASGAIVSNLSPGLHTVSFLAITNWISPASQQVTINEAEDTVLTVWYTPIVGSIRVYIAPPLVVSNGAQWCVDSGAWRDSGTVASNLPIGDHTVAFMDVSPWITPGDVEVRITDTSEHVISSRYTQVTGIMATIAPPQAIAAGAQWKLTTSSTWQDSGTTMGLAPGDYSVEFKEIPGWVGPDNASVSVTNDVVTQIAAVYYDMDIYGGFGAALGKFKSPWGLAISERYLYVADSGNHRIQVLDTLTGQWSSMGSQGTAPGQFNQPFGIALDGSGNLWVADANNHRIQRRSSGGTWTTMGSAGDGVGRFNVPFDVEADAHGNVYVVDHYNHRVQKRTSGGSWSVIVTSGTADGHVRYPNGIAIDDEGYLYVSDCDLVSHVSRIQKFDQYGAFLGKPGSSASGEGSLNRPYGMEYGTATNLIVADTGNSQVQECGSTGAWSVVMNSLFLDQPADVAQDTWGNLFVADTGSNRILRVSATDTDGDMLPDAQEAVVGTLPGNPDTDGDGLQDGAEVLGGSDPLDPLSMFLTPLSPTGTLYGVTRPTFTWTPEPYSTWYYLWINKNGATYVQQWVNGATNWTPTADWKSASYVWWIRGWNTSGWVTDWSVSKSFVIPSYLPGKTTLYNPSGTVTSTNRPVFAWSPVANSSWYYLWVNKGSSAYVKKWVAGQTSYVHTADMPMATYTWWVQTWSADGTGPWSSSKTFDLGKSSPLSPSGVLVTNPPTLTWSQVDIATWYYLWINKDGSTYYREWIPGTGSTNWTPAAALGSGAYRWWIQTWNPAGLGLWSYEMDFVAP